MDRAVALLRALSASTGAQASVSALAETCGLNRTTAWRILTTLEAQRIVVCDRANGRCSIGLGVVPASTG